jgi:hypothetical protein
MKLLYTTFRQKPVKKKRITWQEKIKYRLEGISGRMSDK